MNKRNSKYIFLLCSFLSLFQFATAADLSLQIDFIDNTYTDVGSTLPSLALKTIFKSYPEFSPLKDLKGDPHKNDTPLKSETIKVKAFFHMTGLGYANEELAKSDFKRMNDSLERKLLLNLFALSNHPAEILSQKDLSDKQNEQILLLETSLFTSKLKEGSLRISEESTGLLKSSTNGLKTGWQIVGSFESELKVVTGYLKNPETNASK